MNESKTKENTNDTAMYNMNMKHQQTNQHKKTIYHTQCHNDDQSATPSHFAAGVRLSASTTASVMLLVGHIKDTGTASVSANAASWNTSVHDCENLLPDFLHIHVTHKMLINHHHVTTLMPAGPNCCCLKGSVPH